MYSLKETVLKRWVYVADFAHDEMTVTAGAVDKYARVVVS